MEAIQRKQPSYLEDDYTILYRILKSAKTGQLITYERMNREARTDVRDNGRYMLRAVFVRLQRERGIFFRNVIGQGYRRIRQAEVVRSNESLEKIRRAARRSAESLACVDYDALGKTDRKRHDARAVLVGVIGMLSSEAVVGHIEGMSDCKQFKKKILKTIGVSS